LHAQPAKPPSYAETVPQNSLHTISNADVLQTNPVLSHNPKGCGNQNHTRRSAVEPEKAAVCISVHFTSIDADPATRSHCKAAHLAFIDATPATKVSGKLPI
jgi:hypothetical protein